MPDTEHDVIVVGGGPAGSTTATFLARAGLDVALFEKEVFPREHVGESLLPFCHELFARLGVLPECIRRFARKPGVRFIDRTGQQSTTWCFDHVIKDESYLSFQVIRSEFDGILLDNARRNGVTVHEGTRISDVDLERDPHAVDVVASGPSAGRSEHRARFLIDASGRDALIGVRNGSRKSREGLDRTAIWSHWDGVTLTDGLEEGLSVIVHIGESARGWIWLFALGPNRVTAGFVCQNAYLRAQRHVVGSSADATWAQQVLDQEFAKVPVVRKLHSGCRQLLPAMVNGDYSYEVTQPFGTNYAMVGDARGFIDPIFSSGVYLSMITAPARSKTQPSRLEDWRTTGYSHCALRWFVVISPETRLAQPAHDSRGWSDSPRSYTNRIARVRRGSDSRAALTFAAPMRPRHQ